jgi:hypothetical protein
MALIIGASSLDSVVFPTPGKPQTITIKAVADLIFLDGNLRYLHTDLLNSLAALLQDSSLVQ